jgi:hypothetical protein
VDLGSHIVTDEAWGTPASLGDTFTFLRQHGVIASETALAMRLGTKLRNLIDPLQTKLRSLRVVEGSPAALAVGDCLYCDLE